MSDIDETVHLPPTDPRPRVTTRKKVDLGQLSAEMGVGLCATANCDTDEPTDIVIADEHTKLTVKDLEAAIEMHVPAPPPSPEQAVTAKLGLTPDEMVVLKKLLA